MPATAVVHHLGAYARLAWGYGGQGAVAPQATAQSLAALTSPPSFPLLQARDWYREDLVGQAWSKSGVKREHIFLTSKVHPRHLGYWSTLQVSWGGPCVAGVAVPLPATRRQHSAVFHALTSSSAGATPGCHAP